MFVDASALVAILANEPERARFVAFLDAADSKLVTSVIAVWETSVALSRVLTLSRSMAEQQTNSFLTAANISLLPVIAAELTNALRAYEQYGRHRVSASERNKALNLADCFHYAHAKVSEVAILTKDPAFTLTDLEVVGVAVSGQP